MRAAAAAALAACALSVSPVAASGCSDQVAQFRWDGGQARFAVEIADSGSERAKGLMFRPELAAGDGMLFIYDRPQEVAFWMKNTLIPLDMVFIGPDGRVEDVHPNAVPGDLTPIPGPENTLMVLEISGGLAKRLGLRKGAELRYPGLEQSRAVWRCDAP